MFDSMYGVFRKAQTITKTTSKRLLGGLTVIISTIDQHILHSELDYFRGVQPANLVLILP
jgi:hypothetical protein